jgi:hypothetical protein
VIVEDTRPWFIVVQPNKKYARYSAMMGAITHINMEREAALLTCRRMDLSYDEAEVAVASAEQHPEAWRNLVAKLKGKSFDATSRVEEQIKKTAKAPRAMQ